MIEFIYDNTIDEISLSISRFRRKYLMRRIILFTIAFTITFFLGLNVFIVNNVSFIGPIVMALSLGMIISHWARPILHKRKILEALEMISEEKYTAKFYDDHIIIETKIIPKEEKNNDISDDIPEIPPTVITLGTDMIYSDIDDTAIRLFINRSSMYIFPRRCISEEVAKKIEDYCYDKSL